MMLVIVNSDRCLTIVLTAVFTKVLIVLVLFMLRLISFKNKLF